MRVRCRARWGGRPAPRALPIKKRGGGAPPARLLAPLRPALCHWASECGWPVSKAAPGRRLPAPACQPRHGEDTMGACQAGMGGRTPGGGARARGGRGTASPERPGEWGRSRSVRANAVLLPSLSLSHERTARRAPAARSPMLTASRPDRSLCPGPRWADGKVAGRAEPGAARRGRCAHVRCGPGRKKRGGGGSVHSSRRAAPALPPRVPPRELEPGWKPRTRASHGPWGWRAVADTLQGALRSGGVGRAAIAAGGGLRRARPRTPLPPSSLFLQSVLAAPPLAQFRRKTPPQPPGMGAPAYRPSTSAAKAGEGKETKP